MASIRQTKTMSMLFVALACSLSAPAHAQCGELTWLEAINQGLEANQALVAARQTLDAQQKDLAIARSTMLPDLFFLGQGQASKETTFSSSGGVIPQQTVQAGGEVTETLYNQSYIDSLGRRNTSMQASRDVRRYAQPDDRRGRPELRGRAPRAALMGLQHENVDLSQQSLDLTEAQEQSGEVPYSNVLRTKSQLYGAQQQVVAQKSSLLQSRFQFNQVRNRPAEENCELEPLNVEQDGFVFSSGVVAEALADDTKASLLRDYLVTLGLDRSRSLKSLDAEILAERRTMKSGRRWLIPTLDATFYVASFLKTSEDPTSGDTRDGDFVWQGALTLNWNVLDGGAFIAKMNQSKAEFWSLSSQRNNLATALEENIRGTAAMAMAAFERIGLAVLQAETAEENFALVREAYLDGDSTLLDLIDAQDQLISANTSERQALYQFLSDLLTLEQSIAYFPFLEPDARARVREVESKLQGR